MAGRRRKKSVFESNKLLIIIIAVTFVVSVSAAVAFIGFNAIQADDRPGATEPEEIAEVQVDEDDPYISKNIFVNDVDVGGLTMEQAAQKLKEKYDSNLSDKAITVSADTAQLQIQVSELDLAHDFTEGIRTAYDYTHKVSKSEKKDLLEKLELEPHKIKVDPEYNCDTAKIRSFVEQFAAEVDVEPVNATIERKNGSFIITEDSPGLRLDVDATAKAVAETALSGKYDIVTAVVEKTEAGYKAEELSKAQSLIGSYKTTFSAGNNGRNANIKNAADKINNVMLYPGEVFSTNEAFGAMTYDNGYRLAPVIESGKLKDDFGGGVCQVSSTLYNAVLFAELKVVERQNHSLKVGYVDYGFDATLAGDYIDFKFKNDTDYPLFIEAYYDNSSVTVNIYGNEIHDASRKLSFYNALNETVDPPAELITEDPELELDERVVDSPERMGYRYSVYKVVTENGAEVSRTLVNNSYYKPARAEVRVGTGEAKEEPEPTETNVPGEMGSLEPPEDAIIVPSIPDDSTPEPTPESTPEPVAPVGDADNELPVMLPGYVAPEESGE